MELISETQAQRQVPSHTTCSPELCDVNTDLKSVNIWTESSNHAQNTLTKEAANLNVTLEGRVGPRDLVSGESCITGNVWSHSGSGSKALCQTPRQQGIPATLCGSVHRNVATALVEDSAWQTDTPTGFLRSQLRTLQAKAHKPAKRV